MRVDDVLRPIWCVVIPSINSTVFSNPFTCLNFLSKQIQAPGWSFITSRNTNEDAFPLNCDPSTPPPTLPNASRTCVRFISPNVASFHVPLKPFASLRISPCNICDAFYPTLDVHLISSFCEQQLVITNDNANDQNRSLEA